MSAGEVSVTKPLPNKTVLIPDNADKVFSGVIFDIYQWQQELYDGTTTTFEMLKRPDSVQVLVVNEDGTVVALEQHQPGGVYRDMSLAGGRVGEGESPLQAAKRELLEEVGIECGQWKLVDVRQPEPKIEWFVYLFVASGVTAQREPQQDAGEKIIATNVKFEDFLKSKYAQSYVRKLQGLSIDEAKNLPELN